MIFKFCQYVQYMNYKWSIKRNIVTFSCHLKDIYYNSSNRKIIWRQMCWPNFNDHYDNTSFVSTLKLLPFGWHFTPTYPSTSHLDRSCRWKLLFLKAISSSLVLWPLVFFLSWVENRRKKLKTLNFGINCTNSFRTNQPH